MTMIFDNKWHQLEISKYEFNGEICVTIKDSGTSIVIYKVKELIKVLQEMAGE